MWTDFVRASKGAIASVMAPTRAADPERLRQRIDELASLRGVPSWFDRFRGHELETTAGRLHFDVIEATDHAGTLVFMPGTNAYTLLYGEFLVALADRGWTVVAFDPRGHGRSSGKRGSYTIEELVEDYSAITDEARRRFSGPYVVSGSSQGGITAFYYALGSHSVDAVVCHNLADLSDEASVELTRFGERGKALRPVLTTLAKWAPELPVPMQAYLDLRREPVRGQRHALQVLLEDPLIPWYVRLKTLASLGTAPPPRAIETFETPTLILQAGADTIFPTSYIRRLAERIPSAELEIFEGFPHYMIVDHAEQIARFIEAWLARQAQ